MNGGKPQRLAPFVERTKIAPCGNDAIVEVYRFRLVHEHWLDQGSPLFSLQLQDLAPDELALHLRLNHWLESEAQRIEVLGLHVGTEHTGCVLKELLAVHHCNQEAMCQVAGANQAAETTANDKDASMVWRRHGEKAGVGTNSN